MKNPGPFILIALAAALFFAFTNPQYKKVQEVKAISDKYGQIISSIDEIKLKRDNLLVDYQSISEVEKQRMFKALPDNIDTVHLALDLNGIAAQHGIAITSISVSKQNQDQVTFPGGGPYEKVRIGLTFVSSYLNLQKFLTDMERSLRVLDIRSINFSTSETGVYEYEVTLDTYWHKK